MNEIRCPQCRAPFNTQQGICGSCGAVLSFADGRVAARGQACFECGYESDAPFKKCPECGADVGVECVSCGEISGPAEAVCKSCGAGLVPPDGEEETGGPVSVPPRWPLVPAAAAVVAAFGAFGYLATNSEWFKKHGPALAVVFFIVLMGTAYLLSRSIGERTGRSEVKRRREGGMVEIFRTKDLVRAEYLMSLLRDEGIDATLLNRHFGSFFPLVMKNGLQVLVPEEQREGAEKVLKTYSVEPVPFADGPDGKT